MVDRYEKDFAYILCCNYSARLINIQVNVAITSQKGHRKKAEH